MDRTHPRANQIPPVERIALRISIGATEFVYRCLQRALRPQQRVLLVSTCAMGRVLQILPLVRRPRGQQTKQAVLRGGNIGARVLRAMLEG